MGLFTGNKGNKFIVCSISYIFTDLFVIEITLSSQECSDYVLLNGILKVIELIIRGATLTKTGCRFVIIRFSLAR